MLTMSMIYTSLKRLNSLIFLISVEQLRWPRVVRASTPGAADFESGQTKDFKIGIYSFPD